jgi:hypothetical protein
LFLNSARYFERENTMYLERETRSIGNFRPEIGDFLSPFGQIPLNLHAKLQKNIRKPSILEKKDVSLHLNNINIGEL